MQNRDSGNETGVIPDMQALSEWRPGVKQLLDSKLDLGGLRGRLCPVLCHDGTAVIFTQPEYLRSDQADEVERMLVTSGYRMGRIARWVMPAPLLLSISCTYETAHPPHAAIRDRSALAAAFDEVVTWAIEEGASDLHFNVQLGMPQSHVYCTIEGRYLRPDRYANMATQTMLDMLSVAWMRVRGGNGPIFDPGVEQQGRLELTLAGRPAMLRWASLATDAGPSVCLRIILLDIDMAARSLSSLGYLPSQIRQLAEARDRMGGAMVFAGVVGAGKSMALASLLGSVAVDHKLITLEDPVEYRLENALQVTLGRSLHMSDDDVFDAKLRTLKRCALDDLLLGEIRDRQTGCAFMDVVCSGTRVYATVHTGSAQLIPDRLASDFIGVSRDLLATPGILKTLVYQTLMPRLCANCALPFSRMEEDRRLFGQLCDMGVNGEAMRRRNSWGCGTCRRAGLPELWGYRGRMAVVECISAIDDPAVAECISMGSASLAQHLSERGCTPLGDMDMTNKTVAQCALYRVATGVLDPVDVAASLGLPAAGSSGAR